MPVLIAPRRRSRVARLTFGSLCIAACMAVPMARGEEPPRRGGLLPRPADGVTREELVRRWDLDSDGTIDASEAEVARARMRRERAELWRTTGIDPLTGQARRQAGEQPDEESPLMPPDLIDEPEAGPKPDRTDPALPGSRVPDVRLPDAASPTPPLIPPATTRVPDARKPAASAPSPRPGRDTVTGGVRAGAPAARPGYGAVGGKNDLNAGRRPGTLPRSGGLPARTAPGAARQPAAPAPPLVPAPRISAEEIGGY